MLATFLSYFLFFAYFPFTRDVPWANFILFTVGLFVLGVGVRRAFARPGGWFGKISAVLLSALSVFILAFFVFYNFSFSAQLPESAGAPKVGEKAPDFTLPDQNGNLVSLSEVYRPQDGYERLNKRGVLLVFYRGYW